MNELDRFLGMLSMKSSGNVLDQAGIYSRFAYSRYTGCPRYGLSLYRAPVSFLKTNFVQSSRFNYLSSSSDQRSILGSAVVESSFKDSFAHDMEESHISGFLINQNRPLRLKIKENIKAFQVVYFSLGKPIEIVLKSWSGWTLSHPIKIEQDAFTMRPFYFELHEGIKYIEIKSPCCLLIEADFFSESLIENDKVEKIARLSLPDSQSEIDNRIASIGLTAGSIEYNDFKILKELLFSFPRSMSPIKQNKSVLEEGSIAESEKAKYIINPNDLLNTLSLKAEAALAAGLLYVDSINPNSDFFYILGGLWNDKEKEDGFIWQTVGPLRDSDPFPAITGFSAEAIYGDLKRIGEGDERNGTIGIGLIWDLPQRISGTLQNHPVYYQLNRTDEQDNRHTQDVISGYKKSNDLNRKPPFQLVDFGEDDNTGLKGTFSYSLKGVDVFGRMSQVTQSATIEVNSFTIPPSPIGVEGKLSTGGEGLEIKFAWTQSEYLKDSEVCKFHIHLDYRQNVPVTGRIIDSSPQDGLMYLKIRPDKRDWEEGEAIVGGMIRINGLEYKIIYEISRSPQGGQPCLEIKTSPMLELPAENTKCTIVTNWKDPANWIKKLAIIEVDPEPEINQILSIDNMPGSIDAKKVILQNIPFSARNIQLTNSPENTVVTIKAATLVQHQREFFLFQTHELENSQTASDQKTYFTYPSSDEQGVLHWPTAGATEIFPQFKLEHPDFKISQLDNRPNIDRKGFSIGICAEDVVTDGSNLGPVSTRIFEEWINSKKPGSIEVPGSPDMISVPADRADIDGLSSYMLKWDPVVSAEKYFIFRASKEMLIATDRDAKVLAGQNIADDYYQDLSVYQLWEMAALPYNRRAFSKLTREAWTPELNQEGKVCFIDRTLPGHSRSLFFYAVQPISKTGVSGDFSTPFIPVHCPLARAPELPEIYKYNIEPAQNIFKVYLYWHHRNADSLNYYILYRTESEEVANAGNWRDFEHAIKIAKDENMRPLIVEFNSVDLKAFVKDVNITPLGIFSQNEYEAQFGNTDKSFADANVQLQNHYEGSYNNNKMAVSGLHDFEPVIVYYKKAGIEKRITHFNYEKIYIDTLSSPVTCYYRLAVVDNESNISSLSSIIKIVI